MWNLQAIMAPAILIEKKSSTRWVNALPTADLTARGSFVDDYVALGFRRLSIIDLEGGSQPIHSADGKHVIIFNGEIYNYQEIRKELIEKHGCQFQTNSDTEVILQDTKPMAKKLLLCSAECSHL